MAVTVAEMIGRVRELYPCEVKDDVQKEWLRQLDEQIQDEVIDTHELPEHYEPPDFDAYDMETELIVPEIHAELYVAYLRMKMAMVHADKDEYEINSTKFNNSYITYQQHYNRKHRPLRKGFPRYR